jgi:hypothetical protein
MTATPQHCIEPLRSTARTGLASLRFMALLLLVTPAFAQDQTNPSPDGPWQFKLTSSLYSTTGQAQASDVNLRAKRDGHDVWVGHFQQTGEGQQTREGYEYTASSGWGQIVPSLQASTGGFMGGSVNVQVGQKIYAMAGWGRTNLRNYSVVSG